jgi:DNA-binding MarR family transcriptional regulator
MEINFFVNEKPVKALVALSDKEKTWYASLLAKHVDCTYAHMVNVLDELAAAELVVFNREGRVKLVRLTEKGEELAHEFETVLRKLEKVSAEKKSE